MPSLSGAASNDHSKCGSNQDPQVEPSGSVLVIFSVHLDSFFVSRAASAHTLPKPGATRLHSRIHVLLIAILLDFGRYDRARADETHISDQYVEELRELIQARLSQEVAKFRYTRVVLDLVGGPVLLPKLWVGSEDFFSVSHHRPKLVDFERLAILADALLLERDRKPVRTGDRESDEEKDGKQDEQGGGAEDDVRNALEKLKASPMVSGGVDATDNSPRRHYRFGSLHAGRVFIADHMQLNFLSGIARQHH